jgi:hypothetical protein
LAKIWRVNDLEGVFSHYVANNSFTRKMAGTPKAAINTDDQNLIEFGFARTVGKVTGNKIAELREAAHRLSCDRPAEVSGTVDWGRVDDQNAEMDICIESPRLPPFSFLNEEQRKRLAAKAAYMGSNLPQAWQLWREQSREPETLTELEMAADIMVWAGDVEAALQYMEKFKESNPADAGMLLACVRFRQGRFVEATQALEKAYDALRAEPWVMASIFKGSLVAANYIVSQDQTGSCALQVYRALEAPFSVYAWESERRRALLLKAIFVDRGVGEYTHKILTRFEPDALWDRQFLEIRKNCYRAVQDPLAAKAEGDWTEFLKAEPEPDPLQ